MDYHTSYGLDFNPFIKNSKKDKLIETEEYKECAFRLNYLLENRGFGLITGESGRGKTATLRHWVKTLNTALYNVIYISLSTVTVDQFYYQLAVEFGLETTNRKTKNYANIQNIIRNISIEKKKVPVIILDEASYMSPKTLSDLKMLFNFEMDSRDYAVIILAGLPTLNNTLRTKSNESLKQRISMSYHIDGISKKEVKTYIAEKISSAGCEREIFSDNALEAIANGGNGSIRVINQICNNSLLLASLEQANIIDDKIVMKAINEMELD